MLISGENGIEGGLECGCADLLWAECGLGSVECCWVVEGKGGREEGRVGMWGDCDGVVCDGVLVVNWERCRVSVSLSCGAERWRVTLFCFKVNVIAEIGSRDVEGNISLKYPKQYVSKVPRVRMR